MQPVENVRVREFLPLESPYAFQRQLPMSAPVAETVYTARETIKRIIRSADPRLLVVIGPCSIHDPLAAFEYAERLYDAHRRYQQQLFIVMRAYLEKPRTTTGWRGFLNDPKLDGSFDMAAGLYQSRELLLKINAMGLPVATEMLDPISPQYLSDVISFAAIGARTTESQTHRALASGISMPVGFKNSTAGDVKVAVNAVISARSPHSFLGIDRSGRAAVVQTAGNPDGTVILRGSKGQPNYAPEYVTAATTMMQSAGLEPAVLVDCSHDNSGFDYAQQVTVWHAVLAQRLNQTTGLIGMMVESFLEDGKQSLPADLSTLDPRQLQYGLSVTDACVGWDTTEQMLETAATALREAGVRG